MAAQLAARYPRDIDIDWENYDRPEKLGPVLSRFLPLVREDWPVEAHAPFRAWVDAARPRRMTALSWLLERIASRADLYDSLELLLLWCVGPQPSRTTLRLWGGRPRLRRVSRPGSPPYFHRQPLIRRADVSLEDELNSPPLRFERLSQPESLKILGRIVDTSATRYRELYGFSHPDEQRVFRTDAGRGVEIVFFGVPAAWRLPLRAYHAGMFFKNGVPAGYVEVLSLFERAEVGFNLYYTFREGESAWIFARLLRLFHQILGVRCFSIDPYQIGLENPEAIDSGAFWFYRKLGFRPLAPAAAQLVAREEDRMLRTPGYRSSRRTLEKLAQSYLLYEPASADRGAWDRFRVRTLGLRSAALGSPEALLRRLAARWSREEQDAVEAIIQAKGSADEARYLRLMQRHQRLRAAILKLGSEPE